MNAASAAWIGSGRPNRGNPSPYTAKPQAVRDEALRLRVEERMPAKEIGARLGVHYLTVYRWTRGALDSHGNAYPRAVYEEAVRLRMQEGLSNREITERLNGPSDKTIYAWMGATPRRLGGQAPHPPTLHERARHLKECGFTLSEIAVDMGVPRSTVGDWVHYS